MKRIILLLLVAGALQAVAEIQNVTVNGEIRIRGRYWSGVYTNAIGGPAAERYPGVAVFGRPLGPLGTGSRFDFDDRGHDLSFVEMRTRLGATAHFTNDINAVVELESFDLWGEDFRSDYLSGLDGRAVTTNDVEVYQGYIEANEFAAMPLRLRLGRQEMKFGKGWLVDDMTTAIVGRSWDAIRLTYADGPWEADAWWSKLEENAPLEQDGDVDFFGVYGTYGFDASLKVSAYWMLIRDAEEEHDTTRGLFGEALEDVLGLDEYDPGYLNTVGLRFFGASGPWDYDAELAYQFGNADPAGALFVPYAYGDEDASFDAWGADVEVGRVLDAPWKPRVFLGGAYFSGEDERDLNVLEWLAFGFHEPDSSVSFNRLFPGKPYSLILEINQELSNFWQIRSGVAAQPTEKISVGARWAYFGVTEPFDVPYTYQVGRTRFPIFPFLSFLTQEASDEIGHTTFLWLKYAYSQDVSVTLAWEHLFTGDGLNDGQYIARNGFQLVGGTDDDDADYVHFDLIVKF